MSSEPKKVLHEMEKTLCRDIEEGRCSDDHHILSEAIKEAGLCCGDKTLRTSLKPYFLSKAANSLFSDTVSVIYDITDRITRAYLSGHDFGGSLKLEGKEKELAFANRHYSSTQVIQRHDAFYDPADGYLKFTEFNCSDPNQMGQNDILAGIMSGLPHISMLMKEYGARFCDLTGSHRVALLKVYKEFCDLTGARCNPSPTFVMACHYDIDIRNDIECIVASYRAGGHDARIADPRDLVYDKGTLRLDGRAVDIVYRDSILDFIREDLWPKARATIDAFVDGRVCLVNPVCSAIGGLKSLFAVLTDSEYQRYFSAREREVIDKHIPWTRLVAEGRTARNGGIVDLLPHIRANKDEFVIKPCHGYGGQGVVIGRDSDRQTWENALDTAVSSRGGHCAQALIRIVKEPYPVFDERSEFIRYDEMTCNLGIWSHCGKMPGVVARLSSGTITNISRGGAQVPAFLVE